MGIHSYLNLCSSVGSLQVTGSGPPETRGVLCVTRGQALCHNAVTECLSPCHTCPPVTPSRLLHLFKKKNRVKKEIRIPALSAFDRDPSHAKDWNTHHGISEDQRRKQGILYRQRCTAPRGPRPQTPDRTYLTAIQPTPCREGSNLPGFLFSLHHNSEETNIG